MNEIDWTEGIKPIRRRQFLDWVLGSSVFALFSMVFYPVLRFLNPPDVPEAATNEVEAGLSNDTELLGKGFKIIPFGSEPVILIRLSDNEYRAFAATCTHLDCIVEYQETNRRVWCNCHNGEYDLTGRNVSGPPPRPLTQYDVHLLSTGEGKPATIIISRA